MKEKTLYIDTPPINIAQLSDKDDFQINFDLKTDDFVGTFRIRLDSESFEWDTHDGEGYFPTSCNRLIVSVTTELDISEVLFLENTYFLVIEHLTIFLNYLQTELGQYWVDVGPIRDWDLGTFLTKTTARRVVSNGEEKIGIPIGGYSKKRKILFSPRNRTYPEKFSGLDVKHIPDIKSWFEQCKEPNLSRHLLANSKRSLLHGDYKSSSVLAITALEGPLEAFVKERCKVKGVTREHDSVSYDLRILSSLLEADELTEWLHSSKHWFTKNLNGNQIIEWAIELNKARNDAVHRGLTPAFETIDKGIFAVETIYEFVKEGS